jgi:hypothetical protein
VRAANGGLATEKAFANVRDTLSSRSSIKKEDAASATLVVDEIRENESFLRLFGKHGFVFAPPLREGESRS